jgi:predicted O-methyltransferase YrrM
MKRHSWVELGFRPVTGPFSKYMTPQETALLIALVDSVSPQVMIEFGCNEGITAKRILDNVPTLQRYIGIDVPSDHVPTLECQLSEVPDYAGSHVLDDERFYLMVASSQNLTGDELELCDAVFIDGDHSAAAVMHESHIARALLRPGGIIVWHDYQNPAVEVTQVLDTLCEQGWPIDAVEHSWLAFMRRP